MTGLLLHLTDDRSSAPGDSFRLCFDPIRTELDAHYWILESQPWMGAPDGFFDEGSEDFERSGESDVSLWRPTMLSRWAHHFAEEAISLWAVDPSDDPHDVASRFEKLPGSSTDDFIARHAAMWLVYHDSTCWEIFARRAPLLDDIQDYLRESAAVRVYRSNTADRGRAYLAAGLGRIWRLMDHS